MTTRRLFITGTDTGVGKTHFTVWFARQLGAAGYRVGVYKPVCSGAVVKDDRETWEDTERLVAALDNRWPIDRVAPQCYRAALAPPVAAALEGREVDEELLIDGANWWNERVEILLIEGAGGWMSPVSRQWTNADLAQRLQSPVVLVAGNRLGVISHALLSITAIRDTCDLAGIILNEVFPVSPEQSAGFDLCQSNREEIERRSGERLWGVLSHGEHPELMVEGGAASPPWNKLLSLPPVRPSE